ncbi:hypothetical protein WICPIJ_001797 [Wickerhamomyces pijperi]|uniref:Processing of GAS1 and ALP protein 2 n=1 Tax=Wickerhamomyces pijperi TaxID=599730 RepID=A0A9P8QAW9_WICPI|nr:hypothetical protein WICPIJ_001797 [Wickerhamomyces pijperi]
MSDSFSDKLYNQVYSIYEEFDVYKLIRLIIIVGGYAILRNQASKFLANRQLQQQIDQDNENKGAERIEKLVEKPEAQGDASGVEGNWGWGKKTRGTVKRTQKMIEEHFEKMKAGEVDDDADIADLLED